MTDNIVTETATRIFTDLGDPQTVNRARDGGWKLTLWDQLTAAGLPLAWVPSDLGGADAGMSEGFEIAAIAGKFAAPLPVVETLLAGWVLSHARLSSPGGMMTIAPCRPKDQVHVNANGTLRGRVRHIPFARETEHIAVLVHSPKGLQVALVRTSDCLCTDGRSLAGDTVSDVTLDNVRPVDLSPVQQGLDQSKVMMMGAVLRALQTAAALQVILQMATQYAQDRVAFGKPIGKFQAVQHNLARLAGEASAALTAAGSAAEAIAAIDGDPARFDEGVYLEAASARIRCAEAATEGASIAHQVFGAIGFTKEHVLHRFTMRLLAWRDDFGNESQWALDLGTRIAAKGADELWPLMASR